MNHTLNKYIFFKIIFISFVLNSSSLMSQVIDGIAAIVGDEIILKSEVDQFVERVLNLQSDKDFNFCREIGGKQAIEFLRDKKEPMGLAHLLFNHSLEKIY